MHELLFAVGLLLSFAGSGLYIVSILRGKSQPHLYSQTIWTIVIFIAFAGALVSGGGDGAWIMGSTAILNIVILFLSFKYGTKDIKVIDGVFLAASLAAIIPWVVLKDPLWSVVLATIISVLAFFPALRKTWKAPHSEPFIPWSLAIARTALILLTLGAYTITTVVYPASMLLMCGSLVGIIVLRPRRGKEVVSETLSTS